MFYEIFFTENEMDYLGINNHDDANRIVRESLGLNEEDEEFDLDDVAELSNN
jgi:hypothetical protein